MMPDAQTRPELSADIVNSQDGVFAAYGPWRLTSHFQPIFSLSHCRAIGHEGLLRTFDEDGFPISPGRVISSARDFATLKFIDQLCRFLHVQNHELHGRPEGWLFLNVHPEVFRRGPEPDFGDFLPELSREGGMDPHRIVIEVMEDAVADHDGFAQTVDLLRARGCLIALDDFGAGHSNFDRIWTMQPEIVKLDRSFAKKASEESQARRLLPRIVSLIHEAGSLVLLEGVETPQQALLAMDSDIDFVQGYYFAMPQADPVDTRRVSPAIDELWDKCRTEQTESMRRYRELVAPYQAAITDAVDAMVNGTPMAGACAEFLRLSRAEHCYLLDDQGWQVGANLPAQHLAPRSAGSFHSLNSHAEGRWSRRPYFRRALDQVGKLQVSRPYLSIASGQLCVTVSQSFLLHGQVHVLCGDLSWPQVF
ncbi:MAG: EAL domain-containing protein [Rhodocyclaceae bacterium]|nr:EAL domain-containing protein [Rhodocyclaceae bacterium]MBX3668926.1 EAL domain-containing protein [Rhodocyclaceae bacterium]